MYGYNPELRNRVPDSMMEVDFYVLAALGVLLTGISKSGFAGGIGAVAVPLMASFIGGEAAIGLLLPVLLLMDAMTIRLYWHHIRFSLILPFIPGMLVGVALGTALLGVVDEAGVQMLIGLLGFWVLAQRRWPFLGGRVDNQKPNIWRGRVLGLMNGVGSTLAHSGAAPLQAYCLSLKLPKEVFLAQVALGFGIVNCIKLIPYLLLGLVSPELGTVTLIMVPVALLGVWLGRWLSSQVDEVRFFQVMMVLLAVNSCWLIAQALLFWLNGS